MEKNSYAKLNLRIAYKYNPECDHEFRKNPKFNFPIPPQYDFILASKDLYAEKYIVRKIISAYRYPDYNGEYEEIIAEYNSLEEMADDGWRLF